MIKYLRRTTRGAARNGLGTAMKYLRRITSAAAGSGMDTTAEYLVNQNVGAGNNWAKATMPTTQSLGTSSAEPPCGAFVVNLEFHTGERPSVRLCVGPELARGNHKNMRKIKSGGVQIDF
jgi:hypothetical protein